MTDIRPACCVFILSLLLFYAPFVSAAETLSVKGGYQLLSPQGSVSGSAAGDQRLDLEQHLALDDSRELTGEIALNWGNARLSLNYLPIRFSGTNTLNIAGTFNNRPFAVGDRIASEVEIALYDIGYSYYLINVDDLPTRIQFGPEVAIKLADTRVLFRNLGPVTSYSETASGLIPIPTIGLRARIALADFFGISARLGAIKLTDNHFFDAEAQIEFSPLPLFGAFLGYRYFDLKIDQRDIDIRADFSGPFSGVFVRF